MTHQLASCGGASRENSPENLRLQGWLRTTARCLDYCIRIARIITARGWSHSSSVTRSIITSCTSLARGQRGRFETAWHWLQMRCSIKPAGCPAHTCWLLLRRRPLHVPLHVPEACALCHVLCLSSYPIAAPGVALRGCPCMSTMGALQC